MLINRQDEEDFVKVLDFGISKDLDPAVGSSLTRPNVAIGTPVYMAPEQAAGREANALTDVYGVGGLLYEMLTGAPPCAGEDAIEVLHRKAREDPPAIGSVRPSLPRDVQALVTRALARSPGDRQPSMGALKDQVLACLAAFEDAPAPVHVPGASSNTPRLAMGAVETSSAAIAPPQRSRMRSRVAIAAASALAGALVAVRLSRQGSPTPGAAAAAPVARTAASAVPPLSGAQPPGQSPRAPSAGIRPPEPSIVQPAAPAAPAVAWLADPELQRGADHRAAPELALSAMRDPAAARKASVARPIEAGLAKPTERTPDTSSPARGPASDTTAILTRGQQAFDRGDYPEAVRRGREAISAGGELAGHLLIGDAYFRLERFRDALREYDAALALDPTNAGARRRRDLAEKRSASAPP